MRPSSRTEDRWCSCVFVFVNVFEKVIFSLLDRIARAAFGDRAGLIPAFFGRVGFLSRLDRRCKGIGRTGRDGFGFFGQLTGLLRRGLVELARSLSRDLIVLAGF